MKKTMLLAVFMMLGLAAGAFAQAPPSPGAILQAGTENVTLVVETGHTELTGDVWLMVMVNSNPTVPGTVTFKYDVPFTNPLPGLTEVPPFCCGKPEILPSPVFAALPLPDGRLGPQVNLIETSAELKRLVLDIPAGAGPGEWIRIRGVRLDVAGYPQDQYKVTLSSTGNGIFNGQFIAPVIDGKGAGLKDFVASEPVTLDALKATQVAGTVTLTVKEGFNNAFGRGLVPGQEPLIAQMLRFQLVPALPEGITLTFPLNVGPVGGKATWALCDAQGSPLSSGVVDAGSPDVYYILTTDNDPTKQETFSATVTVGSLNAPLPIPNTTIKIKVTLADNGPAFANTDFSVEGLLIPRYLETWLDAQTVIGVTGAQTALLIPLAQSMPSIGYDTGIAIANTTTDPGPLEMGIGGGAVPQVGKITFYMYQQQKGTHEPKLFPPYTTGPLSPGSGLDADGNLPSGSTYTVLVGELLAAAEIDEEFQGYIIAVAQFTNAHGLYVASNFTTFSQGSHMLVLKGKREEGPESLGQ